MPIQQRLRNLLNKGQSDNSQDLTRTLTLFMKEFGYTPEELWKIPIPTFNIMLDEWNKQTKEEEKAMKTKMPRGRRR